MPDTPTMLVGLEMEHEKIQQAATQLRMEEEAIANHAAEQEAVRLRLKYAQKKELAEAMLPV